MLNTTINRAAGTSPWRRLGKIKLGIKAKAQSGAEYPKDVEYFVIPEEFRAKLGDKPMELEINLAFPTLEQNFDTKYAMYQANGSRNCWSANGIVAHRYRKPEGSDRFQWVDLQNECEKCPFRAAKKCAERGGFSFMVPKTGAVGTFYLKTGSKVAIDRIYTALRSLELLTLTRPQGMLGLRMVLRRELTVFNVDLKGDGQQSRIEKYIPTLDIDWLNLRLEDKALLAPYTGQMLALPPAPIASAEDLEEHDEDDEKDGGAQ